MNPTRPGGGIAYPEDREATFNPQTFAGSHNTMRPEADRELGSEEERERINLASVASETPPESPMAERMRRWLEVAEAGDWGTFFSKMAKSMQPGPAQETGSFAAAARLQPKPATPERFIGELRATLDPSSFVTDRLGEIGVPTLILAGEQDQVVPPASSELVADRIPGARIVTDPDCGHTVRSSFRDYDAIVEAFLAEGD